MIRQRKIPVISVLNGRAVVTTAFKDPYYVSDPANLIRIYSDKKVDELIVVQINRNFNYPSDFTYLGRLAKLCKSPLIMGGDVTTLEQIELLIDCGVERVLLGKSAIQSPSFLREAVRNFGSSSLSVNIDYTGGLLDGSRTSLYNPADDIFSIALKMQECGAGEIIFTAVERNGTRRGYDSDWVNEIASKLSVPVLINGGASHKDQLNTSIADTAIQGACASTTLFILLPYKAVLPVYPGGDYK